MQMQILEMHFLLLLSLIAVDASSIQTTTSRGIKTPTITAIRISTTIDVTPSVIEVIESDPESSPIQPSSPSKTETENTPTSTYSTDWSTVVPTRWYPRRKIASAAETWTLSLSLLTSSLLISLYFLLLS